jgi:hypothetical protein
VRPPKALLVTWLLALSVAVPCLSQAAMLTYLSGGFSASAAAGWDSEGENLLGVTHDGTPSAYASISGTAASAYGGLDQGSTGYSLVLNVNGYANGNGPANALSSTFNPQGGKFIFFRVDSAPGDTQEYGTMSYSCNWAGMGNASGIYGEALSLGLSLDGTNILNVGTNYWGSGSLGGSFQVQVGNIIGIESWCQGGSDQQFYSFDTQCSATIKLDDFSTDPPRTDTTHAVPLPSTLLLLGSGLLRLVHYRRRKLALVS